MASMDEKIRDQISDCDKKYLSKLEYYKIMLRLVLLSLATISTILLAVIGWSYTPIQDIAVLKNEVKQMNKKLDKIILEEGIKQNKEDKQNIDFLPEYDFEILKLKTPALGAICGNTEDKQ